jgi:sugar lactone lactonase YvrE
MQPNVGIVQEYASGIKIKVPSKKIPGSPRQRPIRETFDASPKILITMRLLPAVLIAVVTSWSLPGQTRTGLAPGAVGVDKNDNVFFSDISENVVLRLEATTGVLTVVAGNGTPGFSGDKGAAASAQLDQPYGVAVDAAGDVYIADTNNHRIRKVSKGVITTVAGSAGGFGGDDGPAAGALLNVPRAVAVDAAGDVYIADTNNFRIRKISHGVITTVAGNGRQGFSGDSGLATSAELNAPSGVAVDAAGDVYIADSGNNRIRKVSGGVITTVAGNGKQDFSGDSGQATSAELNAPGGVAVDSAGNLYIVDVNNNRIRKVSNGTIITVAGNGTQGPGGDSGQATGAQLFLPEAIAVDSAGSLYIADDFNQRVRKVSNGLITTVAGSTPVNQLKQAQTITFGALSNRTLGTGSFSLRATASSGLTVTFASDSKAVCAVSGASVTVLAAGMCSVTASQDGDWTYAGASSVTQTFKVSSTP